MNSDTSVQYFYVDLFRPKSSFDHAVLNLVVDGDQARIARSFYAVKHGRGDLIDQPFLFSRDDGLKHELVEFALYCALEQASENPLVAIFYIGLSPQELARVQFVRAMILALRQNRMRAARMLAAHDLNAPGPKKQVVELEAYDWEARNFGGESSPNYIHGDSPEVRLF